MVQEVSNAVRMSFLPTRRLISCSICIGINKYKNRSLAYNDRSDKRYLYVDLKHNVRSGAPRLGHPYRGPTLPFGKTTYPTQHILTNGCDLIIGIQSVYFLAKDNACCIPECVTKILHTSPSMKPFVSNRKS